MRKIPDSGRNELILKKDSWHSFGLQKLSAAKFSIVVNNILSGRFLLVGPLRDARKKEK